MFAAQPENQVRSRGTTAFRGQKEHFANSLGIKGLERIFLVDALLNIFAHESTRVVSTESENHLREIIGAETEKLRHFRYLSCPERGARGLDHDAKREIEIAITLGPYRGGNRFDAGLHDFNLLGRRNQWHHDFRGDDCPIVAANGNCRFENRACLHVVDLRHGHSEPGPRATRASD